MKPTQAPPKTFLSVVLTILIAILMSGFVGLGIATFYTPPAPPVAQEPDARVGSADLSNEGAPVPNDQTSFQTATNTYNRNVSVIALIAAIVIMVVSLIVVPGALLIADGLLLSSVFILIYSIGRSTASGDTQFQFLVVTVGLVITLVLSYFKFVKPFSKV